jgi:TPR repeat protein
LGRHLVLGRGVVKDATRGIALLRKACDAKVGLACANMGDLLHRGKDLPKDDWQARMLLMRGCDANSALACTGVAATSLQDKNYGEAFVYLQRGCNLHDPTGCATLGFLLAKGIGTIPADRPRGLRILRRTCARPKGQAACARLAELGEAQ